MKLRKITKNIDDLVEDCKIFLTVLNLTDEEKENLNKPHNILQLKSFNAIINECKDEIKNSTIEKKIGILRLLYNIECNPFNPDTISQSLDDFVTSQLKPANLNNTEDDLKNMSKIVDDIKVIQESLILEVKRLEKESKKFYVFNRYKRKKIYKYFGILSSLKSQIYLQLEYDAKNLAKNIINDFYNTYIFLSYLLSLCFANRQQILAIEIANAADRYINIINLIFNDRHLKNQDMLYYYLIYELNEMKDYIYQHIDGLEL